MWLVQLWLDVRSSLWFTPGLIVLAAVVSGLALVSADTHAGPELARRWPDLFGAGAAGARTLLATVASSMITIAGVVFSITIVALSLASSQYSPRILRNFMGDRVNQVVLGTFVGIFAYCLVVMRTIRGADEGPFVPVMAVLFGLILAFVGIAMLIYFIHHIAMSIQAVHILADVTRETLHAIDHLFRSPHGMDAGDIVGSDDDSRGHAIRSARTGYVQGIDLAGLLDFATERGSTIRLERGIGDFVIEGMTLARFEADPAPGEDIEEAFRKHYSVGRQRTVTQDPTFGVLQIVDVARRALSPGVNDTSTALMCIDYLSSILTRLGEQPIAHRHRAEDGVVRLISCSPTYAVIVGSSFDPIRRSGEDNVAVLDRLLDSLEWLALRTTKPAHRTVLLAQVRAVAEAGGRRLGAAEDRARIARRAAAVAGPLEAGHD